MSDQPPTPKYISATQAKNNFGDLFKWVAREGRIVYINNNRDDTQLAVVSQSYIQAAEALQKKSEREQAWAEMEALRKEISATLTEEDVQEIIKETDEAFREVIEAKIAKGEIKYIK